METTCSQRPVRVPVAGTGCALAWKLVPSEFTIEGSQATFLFVLHSSSAGRHSGVSFPSKLEASAYL